MSTCILFSRTWCQKIHQNVKKYLRSFLDWYLTKARQEFNGNSRLKTQNYQTVKHLWIPFQLKVGSIYYIIRHRSENSHDLFSDKKVHGAMLERLRKFSKLSLFITESLLTVRLGRSRRVYYSQFFVPWQQWLPLL